MKLPTAFRAPDLRALAWAGALAALVAVGAPRAMAAPELLELDLKQLSELTVTSVSRKEESLGRAPAAVYVITAEQIRASGARNLPELLRHVPGLHVARINARNWAISARGFNARLADKLEVLQDGRTLYTPLFSGVFWDQQNTALEDIERIEVIRGPGGTLWGANAVNGVINIITKPAGATPGGMAALTAGGEYDGAGTVRWGFAPGGAAVRTFVQHLQLGGTRRVMGPEADDAWDQTRGGLRADWRGWTLLAEGYTGQEAGPSGDIEVDGGHLQVGRIIDHDSGRQEQIQAYVQADRRDIESGFAEQRGTLDLSFQQHWPSGGIHDLVWGLGYRRSQDDLRNSATLRFTPDERAVQLFSGFAQDELRFSPDFSLILGTKLEHNDFTGVEAQPTARFSWAATADTTVWGALSRAVRTPNRLDHDARVVGGGGGTPDGAAGGLLGFVDPSLEQDPPTVQDCIEAGGAPALCAVVFGIGGLFPDDAGECEGAGLPAPVCALLFDPADSSDLLGDSRFGSEEVIALELGWRHRLTPAVSADAAVFYNQYDDLRGVEPVGDDARIANALRGTGWGGELLLAWQPGSAWQVQQGLSYLHLDLETQPGSNDDRTVAILERNDPRVQAFLRADWLAHRRLAVHGALRYVSRLVNLDVPAYTELDLGLSWEPWDRVSFDLRGKNLLQAEHPEFGGADASLLERQVFLTVRLGS